MLRSTLIVSLLAVLGSVISFANQLVLAHAFGAGAAMDAYFIGISLPIMVIGLVSGMLGYQLVPLLQQSAAGPDGDAAMLRGLARGLGGIAALVACAAALLPPAWLAANASRATAAPAFAMQAVAFIAWAWLPLAVLGSVYTAGLHVRQRFAWATCWQSLPMIGAMAGCLVGGKKLGVIAVAWGQLAGYAVMAAGLRAGLRLNGRTVDSAGWRRVLAQAPLALASLLVFVIYPFSDAFWGAHAGPAAVSYLGYAQRLLVGLASMLVVGLTTVLFPQLAQHAAAGNAAAVRTSLAGSLRLMLIGMAPLTAILAVLAMPVMQILFQRGAFSLDDTHVLAKLLRIMLPGMVAMSCMGLTFKALFARGEAHAAAVLSLVGAAAYFSLSGLLKNIYGLQGIGMAYSISWWLVLGLNLWFLWRDVSWRTMAEANLGFWGRFAIGAAIAGAVSYAGTHFLPLETDSGAYFRRGIVVVITSGAAMLAYIIFGQLAPIAEIRLLHKKLLAWSKQP